jgi:hypothetical protein
LAPSAQDLSEMDCSTKEIDDFLLERKRLKKENVEENKLKKRLNIEKKKARKEVTE